MTTIEQAPCRTHEASLQPPSRFYHNTPGASMQRAFSVAGRCVGCIWEIGGQRVFVKVVERRKHFLRQLAAYGIDCTVLAALRREHVDLIRVEEQDTRRAFEVPLQRFITVGQPIDLGFGKQIALPLRCWRPVGEPELPLDVPR